MLLIDIGLTILGGPKRSPSSYIVDVLSLPKEAKSKAADLVFCREHASPDHLADDLEELFGRTLDTGQRDKLRVYWESQSEACVPLPGAVEFCACLKERGYAYSIVSNLWKPFHQALCRHLPEFEAGARRTFLSYKMGTRKPGEAFYAEVYAKAGAAPASCLIIGDSLHNDIIPCLARGSGAVLLSSERFVPEADLAEKLATRFPDSPFYFAPDHKEAAAILSQYYSGEQA